MSANDTALEKLTSAQPQWTGLSFVKDIVVSRKTILHAGPPFESVRFIPDLVINSLAFACIYEGWAKSWQEAEQYIRSGEVTIAAAQDHSIVLPLAGVASPSMAMIKIQDVASSSKPVYSVLNEGIHCASRLGQRDDRLPTHHQWLNGEFTTWLSECLHEPVDLYPLLKHSLDEGDDGHAVTTAASRLLSRILNARAKTKATQRVQEFLDESVTFALNIWMAFAAASLNACSGVKGSTIVIKAGSNGVDTGIQLADSPGDWITYPAPQPTGPIDPKHLNSRVARALGDSAVVDFFGLGGQAIDENSPTFNMLASYLPAHFVDERRDFMAGKNAHLGSLGIGIDAKRAARSGKTPVVLLGIMDASGVDGRIGAGVLKTPAAMFQKALQQLQL